MGRSHHLWLCACKTATLGPELQVCMDPRPHLRFSAHITACLAQEYQDCMVPAMTCGFVHSKQRF